MLFTEFNMDDALDVAREEGREDGRRQGQIEGRLEGRQQASRESEEKIRQMAIEMKNKGFTDDVIAEITKLPINKIIELS